MGKSNRTFRNMRVMRWSLLVLLLAMSAASAEIFVKISGVGGDAKSAGYSDGNWFAAATFELDVDREMQASGEKGGTEDINIGVGQIEKLSLTKRLDSGSMPLLQFGYNGNSVGGVEIHIAQTIGGGTQFVHTIIKLDRVFVKAWSIDAGSKGTPMERVELYFSRIAMGHRSRTSTGAATAPRISSWDRVRNRTWSGHNLTFPK